MATKFNYRIEQDTDPQNPRTDFDQIGTMVCWHRRYNLGDEQPKQSIEEWLYDLADYKTDEYDLKEWPSIDQILKRIGKNHVILPLYLYDHSGITISTSPFSCRWDSGKVGFIFIDAETGRKNWGRNWRKKAEAMLEAEVEEYDQYLTGEVYGYVVEEIEVDEEGNEEVIDSHYDSCWGYYGHEYCENEAKVIVAHLNSPESQFERMESKRLQTLLEDDSCEVFAKNFAEII